jgi:hypothetical protein
MSRAHQRLVSSVDGPEQLAQLERLEELRSLARRSQVRVDPVCLPEVAAYSMPEQWARLLGGRPVFIGTGNRAAVWRCPVQRQRDMPTCAT